MTNMRTFSIFLSSSFKDMQVERDFLRKNVFRQIDIELMKYNARLRVIDLRGSDKLSDKEEILQEEAIFLMCLQGIDNCRPRLIGLLGDRYGWVPYREDEYFNKIEDTRSIHTAVDHIDKNDKIMIKKEDIFDISITELEIRYGLRITNTNGFSMEDINISKKNCFFYFRNAVTENGYPAELPVDFLDGKHKQDELKQSITAHMEGEWKDNVSVYDAIWNCSEGRIQEKSLELWGEFVKKQILENIINEINEVPWVNLTSEQEIELLMNVKCANTIERVECQKLINFINNDAENILLVEGESGSGKSTLIAQLYEKLVQTEHDGKFWLVTHVAGIDSDSRKISWMLEHYCAQLEDKLKLEHVDIQDYFHDINVNGNLDKKNLDNRNIVQLWKDRLSFLITAAAHEKNLIILLDSADSLEDCYESRNLAWLPSNLPNCIKIIATSLPKTVYIPETIPSQMIYLSSMEEKDIRSMMISRANHQYGKEWNAHVLDAAVNKVKETGLYPLYAQILTSHLMNMTLDDFKRFPAEDGHKIWMMEQIKKAPMTTDGLYKLLVERSRLDYGRDITDAVLGIIAISRSGFFEKDLLEAVRVFLGKNVSELTMMGIRGLLVGHLRMDLQQEWLDYEHKQIRICLTDSENQLFDKNYLKALHSSIIKAAITKSFNKDEERKLFLYNEFYLSEFLWHAFKADDTENGIIWLNQMSKAMMEAHENVLKKGIVDIINSGEEGVNWICGLIKNSSAYENALNILFLINNSYGGINVPSIPFPYVGQLLHTIYYTLLYMDTEGGMLNAYIAIICNEIGEFFESDGDFEKAEKWYLNAAELRKRLYEKVKDNKVFVRNYVETCNSLGYCYERNGDLEKAEEWYLKAGELNGEAYQNTESNEDNLHEYILTSLQLGKHYEGQGERYKAEKWYSTAYALQGKIYAENKNNLNNAKEYAVICINLGRFYELVDRVKAGQLFLLAEKILFELYNKHKENLIFTFYYSEVCYYLGRYYKDDFQKNEEYYLRAEGLCKRLYHLDKQNPEFILSYVIICTGLGELYNDKGHTNKAMVWFRMAEELQLGLFQRNQSNNEFVKIFAMVNKNMGLFYEKTGDRERAEKYLLSAEDLRRKLYEKNRGNLSYLEEYVFICDHLGNFYSYNNDAAKKWYLTAVELQKILCENNPENPRYMQIYAVTCDCLGHISMEEGEINAGKHWYIQAEENYQKLYTQYENSPNYKILYSRICSKLGTIYREEDNIIKAEEYYLIELKLHKILYEQDMNNLEYKKNYAESCRKIGRLYYDSMKYNESKEWYLLEETIRVTMYEASKEDSDCINYYSSVCFDIGCCCKKMGDFENAEKWFLRGTLIDEKYYEDNPDPLNEMSYLVDCNNLEHFYEEIGCQEKMNEWHLRINYIKTNMTDMEVNNVRKKRNFIKSFFGFLKIKNR